MNVYRTVSDLRSALASARSGGKTIAFVPTMGALHAGHLSLVQAARDLADVVVLSIFVNPLQFAPGEDFERYPRDEAQDLSRAEEAKVDITFVPNVAEMYPPGAVTSVSVGALGQVVEGAVRPGHFDGVATVVVKLLNIVQPTWALFGQKDAQQVAVIRRVVADLSVPVEIVVCPTLREPDGVAMSSRNVYLDDAQRRSATALNEALQVGERALAEPDGESEAENRMRAVLEGAGLVVDYALVVDPQSFGPAVPGRDRLLVVAARAGATRLIDNLLVRAEGA